MRATRLAVMALCLLGASACGDDDDTMKDTPPASNEEQTPPTSAGAISAWLDKGYYKQWHCEEAVHEARSPSPHGFNRICSNDLIADNVSRNDPWPKGAAAVKELYDDGSESEPSGFSVYLKTASDSKDGANFYWYEQLPPLNQFAAMFPNGVAADGWGDSGNAKSICVTCHVAAGADAAHTPSPGARDEVYTPVGG